MIYNLITFCENIENNKSIWEGVSENGITLLIALIAGSIALFQVKSNIVSSARIKWIENLRLSISELYEASLSTALYIENNNVTNNGEIKSESDVNYINYINAYSKFVILSNRVKMYLNIKEIEHKQLDILIDDIDDHLDSKNYKITNQDYVDLQLKEIVKISRIIFKKEWDKSKKIFRI